MPIFIRRNHKVEDNSCCPSQNHLVGMHIINIRASKYTLMRALCLVRAVDEAVGTGSHLQQLATVINDVALNFGGRHFWEPLFILR